MAAHDEMITFLGRTSDDEKRELLRRANALVAPALRGESFGLVLVEAMASECLVVASDIDGYRQAAGGEASLFEPGNPEALEESLSRALAGENSEAIARARSRAERWSMSRLMDDYAALYDQAHRHFEAAR